MEGGGAGILGLWCIDDLNSRPQFLGEFLGDCPKVIRIRGGVLSIYCRWGGAGAQWDRGQGFRLSWMFRRSPECSAWRLRVCRGGSKSYAIDCSTGRLEIQVINRPPLD
jgi:hypothetical protein